MNELRPIPSSQTAPGQTTYQAVAGFAIAAMVCAGLFSLVMVVYLIMGAFKQGSDQSYLLLLLPAAGVVCAILARRQIDNSGGTRIGVQISSAAWWICFVGGAGYAAFVYANQLFMEQDARQMVDKWFAELKEGKPGYAYIYCVEPLKRADLNPDDIESLSTSTSGASYAEMINNDLVQLVLRNVDNVKFIHRATSTAPSDPGTQTLYHTYQIECAEGIFTSTIVTTITRNSKNQRMPWLVGSTSYGTFAANLNQDKVSNYGFFVERLKDQGAQFANRWMETQRASYYRSHLMTCPTVHRYQKNEQLAINYAVLGAQAMTVPLELTIDDLPIDRAGNLDPAKFSPFDDLLNIGFFKKPGSNDPLSSTKLDQLRELWKSPKIVANVAGFTAGPDKTFDKWQYEFKNDQVRVVFPVKIMLRGTDYALGKIIVAVEQPEVNNILSGLRQEGLNSVDLEKRPKIPEPFWKVIGLETDLERIVPPAQGPPGGPQGS
ncbi:MAG: hypothetical protein R3B84_05085 [Zavarzinella sp.]